MTVNMVSSVFEAQEAGEEAILMGSLVFGTALNLVSTTMFSFDMLDLKSTMEVQELKELIWKIMELAGKPNLADFFPFLRPFDPQGISRRIKVYYDRLHGTGREHYRSTNEKKGFKIFKNWRFLGCPS